MQANFLFLCVNPYLCSYHKENINLKVIIKMKQTLLKTMVLTLAVLGGASSVWADGVNLLTQTGITATGTTNCSASISESQLTVTPSATGEFRLTLSHSTGISISTDKVFFVVEMDNTDFQTDNQNLRNIVSAAQLMTL